MTAVRARESVVFEPPAENDGIGRLVIDCPDDAVNAFNPELTEDLGDAMGAARAHVGLCGLIVVSAKDDQWVGGVDLKMVNGTSDAPQIERASQRFQAVCNELARLPFTIVAAINGAALGGGLELALACDYRLGADDPSVILGQPEVSLGLIPAGGGTQRLPRLIGLQRSLDLTLSGRRLNARRARHAGLLDEVVHPAVLERAARAWARKPEADARSAAASRTQQASGYSTGRADRTGSADDVSPGATGGIHPDVWSLSGATQGS